MIDQYCSLTSVIISLFRSSLLFVALVSTFYAHFPFYLPIFSVLFVSSFLFLNIMFVCKKMTSYERLPENKPEGLLQIGDEKALDHSQVTDFKISSAVDPDLIFFDPPSDERDEKFLFGPSYCTLGPSSSPNLANEAMSEETEEDYLIEIPLVNQEVDLKEEEDGHNLEIEVQQGFEDFLSDMNEIGGEDNLIEIDISMGSIRDSGSARPQVVDLQLDLAL